MYENAFVYSLFSFFFSKEKYIKLNISGRCDNDGDVSTFLAFSLLSDCPFMSEIQFISVFCLLSAPACFYLHILNPSLLSWGKIIPIGNLPLLMS